MEQLTSFKMAAEISHYLTALRGHSKWLPKYHIISRHFHVIQNGCWNLAWSHGTSTSFKMAAEISHYLTALRDLTHRGRVTHICVHKLCHHCFRQWLVACLAPSHSLNQCWNIVNGTLRNKFHSRKDIWKCRMENGGHFVSATMC